MYDNAGVPRFHLRTSRVQCPLARCIQLHTARLQCNTTITTLYTLLVFHNSWLRTFSAFRDTSVHAKSDEELCLYRGEQGRRLNDKSIHEQQLASGWSHRKGGGFAECAPGMVIHRHSRPPHPGQAPYRFSYRTPPQSTELKTSADKTPAARDKAEHPPLWMQVLHNSLVDKELQMQEKTVTQSDTVHHTLLSVV